MKPTISVLIPAYNAENYIKGGIMLHRKYIAKNLLKWLAIKTNNVKLLYMFLKA